MYLDAFLELADGQTGTVSVASTNVVDTAAAGDAYSAGRAGLAVVIRIDTAFTASGGAVTTCFQIQSDDTADFDGSTTTLCQSEDFYAYDLVAKKEIVLPIPPNAKRFIRVYRQNRNETASTNVFSAGAWDAYIVKDYSITRELA